MNQLGRFAELASQKTCYLLASLTIRLSSSTLSPLCSLLSPLSPCRVLTLKMQSFLIEHSRVNAAALMLRPANQQSVECGCQPLPPHCQSTRAFSRPIHLYSLLSEEFGQNSDRNSDRNCNCWSLSTISITITLAVLSHYHGMLLHLHLLRIV